MLSESYVLPPSSDYPLSTIAKRYWLKEFEKNVTNPAAKTLIVLHSTSFHKETWEPTLEDLCNLISRRRGNVPVIREVWAIDCPNHGESGQRNHLVLQQRDFQDFTCHKYAEAVHRFLSAGSESGACVDFRTRNLVGIGHSLGANAILLLQELQPPLAFSSLVIAEPMVTSLDRETLRPLRVQLVDRASKRRKSWNTLEEARKEYKKPNRRSAKWDPRVLDSFFMHALYWKEDQKNFGLSCTVEQEIAMYRDEEGPSAPVKVLDEVCHRIPVHLILGDRPDFIPKPVQNALVDPKADREFASVRYVPNTGHLIPQEAPKKLAERILDALSSDAIDQSKPSCRL